MKLFGSIAPYVGLAVLGSYHVRAEDSLMEATMKLKMATWKKDAMNKGADSSVFGQSSECDDGEANGYECKNVDFLSYITINDLGLRKFVSDMWGWVDESDDNREYGLLCGFYDFSFVDFSDAENPLVVATLQGTTSGGSYWCDVKTYSNHAYIVRDNVSNAGVQIFDLTNLKSLREDRIDSGEIIDIKRNSNLVSKYNSQNHGRSHNIIINENSASAYTVGGASCNGGIHQIDLEEPGDPKFDGCYRPAGQSVHDAQCVTYKGPDERYTGKEICLIFNGSNFVITDHTNKNNVVEIARTTYTDQKYVHQGWFTQDQRYMLSNDEMDESDSGNSFNKARTIIWDLSDLENPIHTGDYFSSETSIDHNLYIWENQPDLVYAANYMSGLRIYDISEIADASLKEVAFFDVLGGTNKLSFVGTWSSYLFPSGVVITDSMEKGVFALRVRSDKFGYDPSNYRFKKRKKSKCILDDKFILMETENISKRQCVTECKENESCKSASYSKQTDKSGPSNCIQYSKNCHGNKKRKKSFRSTVFTKVLKKN